MLRERVREGFIAVASKEGVAKSEKLRVGTMAGL